MAELKEATVPDIGDYDDVPVIELLVQVGDTVARDQGLVTLESDKATMEVPAPFAGVVRELKVKLGDAVKQGVVVAMIEPSEAAASAPAKSEPAAEAPKPAASLPSPAGGGAGGEGPDSPQDVARTEPSPQPTPRPSLERGRSEPGEPVAREPGPSP